MSVGPVAFESTPAAQKVIDVCRVIAGFSDDSGNITRTFLSPATRRVHEFLGSWMTRLGMESSIDGVGNLRGIYGSRRPAAPRLLIGSHIDTVPNAGAYDGVLGVVLALALVEALEGNRLDYDIEVVAFSEEEGVRFGVPFIGSRALIGEIDEVLLAKQDPAGTTVREAIEQFGLQPSAIPNAAVHPATFAYVEFHIEQGPVLEDLGVALGIVEAIVGQSRYDLAFHGKSNHAGTTPMHLRSDALAGAAEWITGVEFDARSVPGLVATIGRLQVLPGATNVVPGAVRLSLDIRHATDSIRLAAIEKLLASANRIASERGLIFGTAQQMEVPATAMSPRLAHSLETAAIATGVRPNRMVSGAGHDAMLLAKKIPSAMLFLRSPGGISHHPDEAVLVEDVRAALDAGLYFLKQLDANESHQ